MKESKRMRRLKIRYCIQLNCDKTAAQEHGRSFDNNIAITYVVKAEINIKLPNNPSHFVRGIINKIAAQSSRTGIAQESRTLKADMKGEFFNNRSKD